MFKDSVANEVINEEIEQIQNQIMSRRMNSSVVPSVWKVISVPEIYKPLLIINAFFAFQQFTGTFVIVVYATKFVESTSADVDIFLITVLIGVSRVIGTLILAFFILDRFGRKPPTIFSGIGKFNLKF
jgi:MFS family permease